MNYLVPQRYEKIRKKSKEYFKVVYAEDAAVADFATFVGGKLLDVLPTVKKRVTE